MGNKPIEMPPIMVCFEDMQHFMALDEVNKQLQSELANVKGEIEREREKAEKLRDAMRKAIAIYRKGE